MRDDRELLRDVLEAIERIEKHTGRGRQAFESDDLIQTYAVHHILILGEACRSVSAELKQSHPEVPWKKIVGMRHILVHHYFEIDTDVVWSVIEKELPTLKRDLAQILGELER